jgi:integrase
VSAAVDDYVKHLRERGLADGTTTTVAYRLKALLQTTGRDRRLADLSSAIARQLFAARAAKTKGETQRGELVTASAFARWCVQQGWLKTDPFEGLAPARSRTRGKPQLRIDEARRLLAVMMEESSPASIGAAMTLLMGLRASEVTKRAVRDVDDGARVLWIERAKTRAGDRHLEIPELLRAPLAELCAGRPANALIFPGDRHWLGYHVRRLCKVAKVPELPPQAMRGTWSSIAAEATPVDQVARALGHVGPTITRQHYLARGAERAGQQQRALRVITGGRP